MRKFWHVLYVIVMRIFFFILFLALLPMWLVIGFVFTLLILFGQADDIFVSDSDDEENKNERNEECPEFIDTPEEHKGDYENVDKES